MPQLRVHFLQLKILQQRALMMQLRPAQLNKQERALRAPRPGLAGGVPGAASHPEGTATLLPPPALAQGGLGWAHWGTLGPSFTISHPGNTSGFGDLL